ncbi:T9SS type A sorting domain-containing protein, partial [Candidatus Cloacimonadota bacterium]
INSNGCPTVATYGGMAEGGQSRWMSGYDNYYSGMPNRTLEMYSINVSEPEGLEIVKNWMYDHLEEDEVGGLVNFSAGVSGWVMAPLPAGSPEAGKNIILSWDPSVNHAMTFIGYDDSIRYDYNMDGQFTNDIDINNDGIVNMKDWEIGALLMANSWGEGWADEGKSYVMYRLLAELTDDGGIWGNTVHVMRARDFYVPYLTLKATINHDSRNKLKLMAGVASDAGETEPELIHEFPLFNYQGGDFYMQGGFLEEDKTIEIGLDITPLLSGIETGIPARFFFMVENMDTGNVGTGEIISFSIFDHLAGGEEIVCTSENIPIVNNETTIISLERTINFQGVEIVTDVLPECIPGIEYQQQLIATSGTPPYTWAQVMNYEMIELNGDFPPMEGIQLIPTNNDDGYAEIDLEFSFPFYTEEFDHLLISTDGSILFGESFQYVRSEANIKTAMTISPYCADLMLYPEFGDGIWFDGNSEEATFHWKTSLFSQPDVDIEFLAMINSSGDIEFQLDGANITPSINWASGISRGDHLNYTISDISGSSEIPENYYNGFTKPDMPDGFILTEDGIYSGITDIINGYWELEFRVTDFNNIFSEKSIGFSTSATSADDVLINPVISKLTNYPNPFNPSTKISFHLNPENSVNTELTIYNLKGQKVKEFIFPRESLQTGLMEVTWDGHDDNNVSVSSGIYFYKVKSGTYKLTKKMLLLK